MTNNKKRRKISKTKLAQMKVKQLAKLLPGGSLEENSHDTAEDGVCLMEAVAWIAGEEHSDHPKCACPVLTSLGIEINDSTDDFGRQLLIQAIPALIGSATKNKKTLFRRARRAVELAVEQFMLSISVMSSLHDLSTVDRLLADELASTVDSSGRIKSYKHAYTLSKCINAIIQQADSNIGSEFDVDLRLQTITESLADFWDTSNGISLKQYDKLFGDGQFNDLIDEDQLAPFFVEVATQRAS